MTTYNFDCYVVQVEDQPDYDPPQSSVQIYLNGMVVEAFTIGHNTPVWQVLALILAALEELPPCGDN